MFSPYPSAAAGLLDSYSRRGLAQSAYAGQLAAQQQAYSAYAQSGLAQHPVDYSGLLNSVRPAAARISLPTDWAEFCERVQDWSTDRLRAEIKRMRAARSVAA